MIDADVLDLWLKSDPDVTIVQKHEDEFYSLEVAVDGMPISATILVSGILNKLFVSFVAPVEAEHLAEAFAACENIANVGVVQMAGSFYFRSAIFKDFSEPLAVTNTLQTLAVVAIGYAGRVLSAGDED